MAKTRYAVVGTGGRSLMYIDALVRQFPDIAELVALCDKNPGRLDVRNNYVEEHLHKRLPTYSDAQFDQMISEQHPDRVIVTTGPDRTHAEYIIRAMRLGCDVVTEKPMTIDEESVRQILAAKAETGRSLQVTFNYRYSPPRSQVRQMIMDGNIGEVLSVDFAWTLDTRHGADYFRRWHRRLENSGSLLVHKATHHFDLVNWWIDDVPQEVFAFGTRKYYTPETADALGLSDRSERCLTCPAKERCNFSLDLKSTGRLAELYLANEQHDGYFRDRCVFSNEIDIWDTMSVTVKYRKGALLSYILHAYSPVEGYRIAFNGTKGRIEHHASENTYISGDGTVPGELQRGKVGITYVPEFQAPRSVEPATGSGGHGGGDPVLLADIFDPNAPADPLRRKANQVDGSYSVLIGVAAYRSIQQGKPVSIPELLGSAPLGER